MTATVTSACGDVKSPDISCSSERKTGCSDQRTGHEVWHGVSTKGFRPLSAINRTRTYRRTLGLRLEIRSESGLVCEPEQQLTTRCFKVALDLTALIQ